MLSNDAESEHSPPTSVKSGRRLVILLLLLGLGSLLLAGKVALDPSAYRSAVSTLCATEPSGSQAAGSRLVESSNIIERDGKRLLWGGPSDEMHFDITDSTIELDKLRYGLGREALAALIEPRFLPAKRVSEWLDPAARVLAVHVGDEVRVYPIRLLARHEVVNDTVGGHPIFAAYCILADLGAVYDRRMENHVFTFAVSGYTFGRPDVWDGRQAFLLWDRDTESLWWPTLGKAVSGPMRGANLPLFDRRLWRQTTWHEVHTHYPQALVLAPGQNLDRPTTWPTFKPDPSSGRDQLTPPEIAPKWGRDGARRRTPDNGLHPRK